MVQKADHPRRDLAPQDRISKTLVISRARGIAYVTERDNRG
jgi:hypothetical protein